MSTIIQRRRNKIQTIKEENKWITVEKNIEDYFLRNFKELFTSSHPSFNQRLNSLGNQYVNETENMELIQIPEKR